MPQGWVLFWAKRIQALKWFVLNKGSLALELVMPILVKAKDPFLGTKKKMGSTLSLEIEKQTAVAIVDGCSRTIQKKNLPSKKGKRKGVKIPSPTLAAP